MSITSPRRVDSEEQFRLLIDHALDIITIIEADGTIRYESPSCERVLGFRPEELVGRNAFELMHPDDLRTVLEVYLPAIGEPGSSATVEFRFASAGGGWVYLEALGTNLLEHPSLHGILITSRDITARKKAEAALHELNETLERRVAERTLELAGAVERLEVSQAMQKRFVADASHDLRTPLTVIRAELDLLSMEDDLAGEVASAVERMKDEITTLDHLTRDLLMLARLDADRRVTHGPVQLASALRDELQGLLSAAHERGLVWEVELDENAAVAGDATALARALRNVVENAVLYADEGTRVGVRIAVDGDDVEAVVENVGVGIPAKDIERVFDRFYRTDLTRAARRAGLGLSIVRSVVLAHGGEVTIASTPGATTRVTIRLPRHVSTMG